MTGQMSAREKTLAALVGALVFAFVTLLLVKKFTNHHRELRQQLADKTALLDGMTKLIAERDLWVQRDAWLTSKQPKLENASRAATELLEQTVQPLAKSHNVLIENPNIPNPVPKPPFYQSYSVNFETKSGWPEMVDFLEELQAPDKFVVFESANLTLAGDKKQVLGKFRLARWYSVQ
jgi:hypothetical protein